MIDYHLQRFAAQIFIDIFRRLITGEVLARETTLSKCIVVQRKESGIIVCAHFDPFTAQVTLAQMIAYRQEFRGG